MTKKYPTIECNSKAPAASYETVAVPDREIVRIPDREPGWFLTGKPSGSRSGNKPVPSSEQGWFPRLPLLKHTFPCATRLFG
ncbi:MAG: hypothetical protein LBL07_02775 [Tannerella sp.]|nr:hypothetical protein [Tannerella sp.]